jgi:putative membrane protein
MWCTVLLSMLRALVINWIVLAVAFALTSWIVSGMDVSGGVWSYIWVSALFGIVNAIIGTIVRILTLPLTILTLGLFSIVVNAALLEITDSLSSHLTIDGFFWTAIWAALILSLVSVVLDLTVGRSMRRTAAG